MRGWAQPPPLSRPRSRPATPAHRPRARARPPRTALRGRALSRARDPPRARTFRLRPERGGPRPGGRCGWDGDAEGLLPGAAARLLGGAEAAAGLPARGWMPRACGSLRFPPSRGASHGRRGR